MSWARLTKKMQDQKDAQAEREHKVVQSWVRLIFRSQGCSYKIEDVVRQWPRMAEFLLARNETDGWKLGIGRAGRLNAVLTRWRRLGHQVHIGAAHAEAQWGHDAANLIQQRMSGAAEEKDIIRAETLGVLKKKSILDRFCVLYKDRLDYFTTEESSKSDPPRGHVSLKEVASAEAKEDGFTLNLTSGQSLSLKMAEESKNAWLSALQPLLRINKAKHVGYLNAERKGKVMSIFFVLQEDCLDRHDTKEDFEALQEPRGTQMLSAIERFTVKDNRFIIDVRNQKKPLDLFSDDQKEFKAWTQAFQQSLGKSLGANFVGGSSPAQDSGHASADVSGGTTPRGVKVLCEGELLVKKKSKEEPRYCVLRTDWFEYFLSEADYRSGASARCRALMEDITHFEAQVEDKTIKVTLDDKSIEMRATTMEDFKRWEKAWNTEEEDAQVPPPTTTMTRLPQSTDKVVCSGRFDFREGDGEVEPIIFALREASIEIYKGTDTQVVNSGPPAKRVLIEDIKDVEVEEDQDKFIMRLADRKSFELLSPQGRSLDAWYDELSKVFEEADSGRTSAASKVSGLQDLALSEVDELAKALLKSVRTVNVMLKTERTVNQRPVGNVTDFFKAMAQGKEEIPTADFVDTLGKLDIGLTQEQMVDLMLAMDTSPSGGLTLPEVEKVLQLGDKDSIDVAKKVIEKRKTLPKVQERATVRFEDVDVDNDGFISRAEFEKFRTELASKADPSLTRQLPGEMEEDGDDILQPSSPSRPAKNRAICSGAVDVNGQPRHGVLYPDRMAFFTSGEDIVLAEPWKIVQVREVQTVKVTPGIFEVSLFNPEQKKGLTGNITEDLLREHNVTSLCTVTLLWGLDGAVNKSDLDLHTYVNGVELYFKRRTVESCKLDFDANSKKAMNETPAENISVNQPGTFDFFVNNFNNRDNADVPFKVVVRKSGREVAEHQGVWPKTRVKGDYIKVCTVTVSEEETDTWNKKVSQSALKVQIQQAFETWQSCLAEVLAPTFSKDIKGKTVIWRNLRSPTDTPVRLPKRGMTRPMHHGPLKVVREDGSEQVRYFLVFSDRFEHFTDAASAQRGGEGGLVNAMDVRAVRVVEEAFIFELHNGSLEVRVPVGEDMEIWVSAFQLLFHPGNEASQTPNNIDDAGLFINRRSPFLKDGSQISERGKFEKTAVASEVNDERFQHWLQTLPEKVVHWGLLGFQHQQRLAVRLTILFKDRMDSWGSALQASFGVKEDSRILMSSIRGVETVSGGLILNLGGKKVGIHVGGNESLHQWSKALLSVLAPNKAERSTQLTSPQEQRARSETPRATPRKGRDWVPEVAFRTTKSISAGDGALGGGKRTMTVVHRGVAVNLKKERDSLKRFCINTHKMAPEVMELLHGKQGKFLPHSDQPGQRHVHPEIAQKPQGRSGSAISTRSTSREEGASKVTGNERQISPSRRVDHSFAFWKINTEEAVVTRDGRSPSQSDRSIGSRSRSRTPVDDAPLTPKIGSDNRQALRSRDNSASNNGVSGKVGAAGRQHLQAQRRSKSQSEPLGKVTDAGREQNGWAADNKKAKFSFADKVSMAKTAPVAGVKE